MTEAIKLQNTGGKQQFTRANEMPDDLKTRLK